MAPRKKSRSVEEPPVRARMRWSLSAEAEERYRQDLVNRTVVPERGFDTTHSSMYNLRIKIADYHWDKLAESPGSIVMPIVREFYANAVIAGNSPDVVSVRGKLVSFSTAAIAELYELPRIDRDDFRVALEDEFNPTNVLKCLAANGSAWKMSKDNKPLSLRNSDLYPNARMWLQFISSRLIPGTNTTHVTKERAVLIFCIMEGKNVDIPSLIHRMLTKAMQDPNLGMWFPATIFELCRRAGVSWDAREELQHPPRAINYATMDMMMRDFDSKHDDDEGIMSQPAKQHIPNPSGLAASSSTSNNVSADQWHQMENFMRYQVECNRRFAAALHVDINDLDNPFAQTPSANEDDMDGDSDDN